jgi:cadmium resistance protein CadD (predicted permease)
LDDILIFKQIADLKMAPLIHIWTNNADCVYDKNAIVSITDFLVQIFIVTVTSNFLFKNFMVTVIAGHWTTWIFHVVIGPLGKIEFTIRYTHL